MDVDSMSVSSLHHDGCSNRFLFIEYKHHDEALDTAARWALRALSRVPGHSVWMIRRPAEEQTDRYQLSKAPFSSSIELSASGIQDVYRQWWEQDGIYALPAELKEDRPVSQKLFHALVQQVQRINEQQSDDHRRMLALANEVVQLRETLARKDANR